MSEKKAAVIGLVGRAGYVAVVRWISRFLLRLERRTQIPRSVAWFGRVDKHLLAVGLVVGSEEECNVCVCLRCVVSSLRRNEEVRWR